MSLQQKPPPPNRRVLSGTEDFDGLREAHPTLSGPSYWDPEVYRMELERIFYRHWIFLCHSDSVAETRAFRRFTIGNQGIFLVRDEDGTLRGFHNTCRHRGSTLCVEEQGRLTGRAIRCPYHQWAYGLDGRLVATTSHAVAPDFDKADYPLYPVAVREWRGCVFACLSDDAPDLEEGFERGSDRIEHWPLEDLKIGHVWRKVMDCNWKVFWENFNECLHCPNIHPELCDLVPIYGRRISSVRDAADWQDHRDDMHPRYAGGLREGGESWTMDGRPVGAKFDRLTEAELQRGQSYFVSMPSVFIAAHRDYMRTVRVLPLGPEQTEIVAEWLFPQATLDAMTPEDLKRVTDFGILVMQQDGDASALNQQGLRSHKYEHGVLMPEEHWVKGFHDWVREALAD